MSRGKFLVVDWQDRRTGQLLRSVLEFTPDGKEVVVSITPMSISQALNYFEFLGGKIVSYKVVERTNYPLTFL